MWARGSQRCLIAFVLQVMVVLLIGAALVKQTFQRTAMDVNSFQAWWMEPTQSYLGGFQTRVLDWYPVGRSADERAQFSYDVDTMWDNVRNFHPNQTLWKFPEGKRPQKRLAGKVLINAKQLRNAKAVDAELRQFPQGEVLSYHSLKTFHKLRKSRRNWDKYMLFLKQAKAMPPPLEMAFGHAVLNTQQKRALQDAAMLKRRFAAREKMYQGQPEKYQAARKRLKESYKKRALQQHRAFGEKFGKAMPPARPSEEQAYGDADKLHAEDLIYFRQKHNV